MTQRTLRQCREALKCSQPTLAAELGVSLETYRVWDSGRRTPPSGMLERARALVAHRDDQELLPLAALALLIGVHARTVLGAASFGIASLSLIGVDQAERFSWCSMRAAYSTR